MLRRESGSNIMAWIWKSTTDDPFPTLAAQQLKLAISQMKEDINTLFFKLRNCKRELRSAVDDEGLWSRLQWNLSQVSGIKGVNRESDLGKKLEKLIEKSPWFKYSNTSNVVNISSKKLNKYQIELLGYGVNFSLPHQKNSLFDFIGQLEKK